MENQKPIKLSRSSVDLFLDCQKCFYLKIKHRLPRPNSPKVSLNLKVDELLKKEFDTFRSNQSQHPIMQTISGEVFPYSHPDLEKWRHNFTGIQYKHKNLNFLLYGSVDDLWFSRKTNQVIVVDYKATSSQYPPSKLRLNQYSQQLGFYNWLLKKNNIPTHDTNYILLANAHTPSTSFDNTLRFNSTLIPIPNSIDWIEPVLTDINNCLSELNPPNSNPDCKFCKYTNSVKNLTAQSGLPFEFV